MSMESFDGMPRRILSIKLNTVFHSMKLSVLLQIRIVLLLRTYPTAVAKNGITVSGKLGTVF